MKCLVFAPGIMGTQLDDPAGNLIWPPTAWEYMTGYGKIDQLVRDDLVPSQIIYKVFIKSVYKTLLDDIRNLFGYSEQSPDKRFIPFPYDWRRSNSDSAKLLADKLDQVLGSHAGPLDITFLGHSMGGLVMRYLLESGEFNDRSWFDKINVLITMGTPHSGAPKALLMLQGKEGTLGLNGGDVKQLANDPKFPAVFQLVPPKATGLTTARGQANGLPEISDPFRPEIVSRFEFRTENVESSRSFWAKLNLANRPKGVDYFCFGGGYHETVVSNEYLSANVDPEPVKIGRSGDETVPVISAIPPGFPHQYTEKEHSVIFEDRNLRRFLFDYFEVPTNVRPFAAGEEETDTDAKIGISLGKPIYDVGETVELLISYDKPVFSPNESIQFVEIDERGEPVEDGHRHELSFRFRGAKISNFAVKLSEDFARGFYEVNSASRELDDPSPTILIVRGEEP